MFVSYQVMSVLTSFQNFPQDKTDKNAGLMNGRYLASIRGDEFCHRIPKFLHVLSVFPP